MPLSRRALNQLQRPSNQLNPARAKHRSRFLRIEWLAEVKALSMLAAGGKKESSLSFGFNAFSNNLDAKLVSESDGGAHHSGAARVTVNSGDQFLRNLDAVDRIVRQIVQR